MLDRKFRKQRKSFCGECLREINGKYPDLVHKDNGAPMCKPRQSPAFTGDPIEFKVDTETRDRISSSGLDPRNSEYWEVHAAADGNKGWRTWRGKTEHRHGRQQGVIAYKKDEPVHWCANCMGFRMWTHECVSHKK